jgi:DNA repair ATPase RecN
MTQKDNNISEQTPESDSLESANQAGRTQPVGVKTRASNLASKVGEIEKELAQVSTTLEEEAKTIAFDALDLARHPSRYAEQGASLVKAWLEKVWGKWWVPVWEQYSGRRVR